MINKPKGRANDLVMMNLENDTLIYDLVENRAFCLNKTSAMVWESCNGKNSVSEINNLLSRNLKTLISEDLVWLALDELQKNNLLEDDKNHFPKIDRRRLIKKIGLSSMIALPVISSVIVPNAAMAGSCNGLLLAPGSPVGPTTFTDLNVSNFSAGDICLNRLKAQCCSNEGTGSCSCSVVSCIGSLTCS